MCGLFLLETAVTVSTTSSSATFVGNGTTGPFPCNFRIFSDGDVTVSLIDTTNATSTPLVLNADYTIVGAGDQNGFTLATMTAVSVGKNLLVKRNIPIEQPTDFTNQGSFFPSMHEDAFDRTVMMIQQIADQAALNVTMPAGLSPSPSGVLPIPSAGSLLGWAQDLSKLVNVGSSGVGAGSITDVNISNSAGISSSKLNYTPVGAGAVTNTVQNKIRNLDIDWKDFGIVADGVTDDSAALEKAINAANGRRLILPYGTAASPAVIKITRPLVLTSGIAPHLIGFGADKTIIRLVAASMTTDALGFLGAPRGMKVTGIRFDQNNVPATVVCAMLNIQNAEDIEISYCEFLNFDKLGLGLNGGRYFDVHHNRFTRASSLGSQNQAFILSSSSRPAFNGRFGHNTCLRSAIDIDGNNIEIHNNDISLWGFGAGVTTEQSANSNRYTIRDNWLYSGTGTDTNGYRCGGIENWGAYSSITGNKIFNNSGSGIDQGGQYTYVAGNICYNNGQSGTPGSVAGGQGIISRIGPDPYNAKYATYVGNTCYDSQTNKTQGYGYYDESSSLVGITLRGNKWGAHLTGTEFIQSFVLDHDGPVIQATYTTDPPSLASGARASFTQTLAGARVGDFVEVSFSNSLQDIELWGYVSGTNTVIYVFDNNAAGTIDLASGTVRVRVKKPMGYVSLF